MGQNTNIAIRSRSSLGIAFPVTFGKTYKVTLLGSAKDTDGNTLGSDVVKYITP